MSASSRQLFRTVVVACILGALTQIAPAVGSHAFAHEAADVHDDLTVAWWQLQQAAADVEEGLQEGPLVPLAHIILRDRHDVLLDGRLG